MSLITITDNQNDWMVIKKDDETIYEGDINSFHPGMLFAVLLEILPTEFAVARISDPDIFD